MSTEFIEELEALQSVYSDLKLTICSDVSAVCEQDAGCQKSSQTATSEDLYAVINLSCTPRSSSTSFVSSEIQLCVPTLYPVVRPVFKVLKSCGLSDEGKEIEALVSKFIAESPPEECLLFQVVCLVYDFLDDCNIGECLICAEELVAFDFQGDNLSKKILESLEDKLYGLKTPCCHCFHMACLAHWAAVSISQKEKKKSGNSWITERDQNVIRTLEGQIKSTLIEINSLNRQKEKLTNEVKKNEKEFEIMQTEMAKNKEKEKETDRNPQAVPKKNGKKNSNINNNEKLAVEKFPIKSASEDISISKLQICIDEHRAEIASLIIQTRKTKNYPEKAAFGVEVAILQEKIHKCELLLNNIDPREVDDASIKESDLRLKDLRIALSNVVDKIARTNKKLEADRNDLATLLVQETNKTLEKNTNRTFPCAYCRTVLSSATCVISDNKNERIVFNHFLDKSVSDESAADTSKEEKE